MPRRDEAYIPGLNRLLRDLRQLPKEYQGEIRDASVTIATRYMVPAWKAAAMNAGPWGPRIAASVRARRDRVPAVNIGGQRKAFSGGASPTMVRYPADQGRVRKSIPAAFTRTNWIAGIDGAYIGPAMNEWGQAVDRVCRDFNNGPDL